MQFTILKGGTMSSNIWDSLAVTDAKYTKAFKRSGGFSGTDINPAYRLKKMKDVFGICGEGWGWILEKTWREEFCGDAYVFAQVNVWTGNRANLTGAQIGGTQCNRTPDEAYKMAITDALGKCMLALGVCADVYLGEFDTKYSRESEQAKKATVPAKKEQAKPQQTHAEIASGKLLTAFKKLGVEPLEISTLFGDLATLKPSDIDALRSIYKTMLAGNVSFASAYSDYDDGQQVLQHERSK